MSAETENVGSIEIRWNGDDPDDVVAPWPWESFATSPVTVHIERMGKDAIWAEIRDHGTSKSVVMWFTVTKKGRLKWAVTERRG